MIFKAQDRLQRSAQALSRSLHHPHTPVVESAPSVAEVQSTLACCAHPVAGLLATT